MKDPLTYSPIDTGRERIDWILVVLNLLEFFCSFFL